MLENPHGYGEGKPLSLTSGCKGTHTASQEPLDTALANWPVGCTQSAQPNTFPSSAKVIDALEIMPWRSGLPAGAYSSPASKGSA